MATQVVVVQNAPAVYMTGVQLHLTNNVYLFPSITVPDSFSLRIRASPLNAGNVLVGPIGSTMTVDKVEVLRPGDFLTYKVINADLFQALAFAADSVVILSCEYGKRS